MLISGGEHSAADSCFIMLLADTNAATVSITKGFCRGRLAFCFKTRYLSIFSLTQRKTTFMICQQIERRDR